MNIYPWQQSQWRRLQIERQQNRLPHALLLLGNRGLGKADFAKALAQITLCESGDEFACEHCRSCRLFIANNHPDFNEINVAEKSKLIKIEQIRGLIATLNQTAHSGGYQVVMINSAETMNRAAADALLKTLEEPSGKVLLLLICHQLGYLPATIISRCQRLLFTNDDHMVTLSWLKEHLPGNENIELLLKMANDAPLRALELSKGNYLQLRDNLLTHLWKILQKAVNPINSVNEMLKQNLEYLLYAFITIVMDTLRYQLKTNDCYIVNSDRSQYLQDMSMVVPRALLLQLLSELQAAQKIMQGTMNINVQLFFESLFLKWELSHVG